MMNISIIITHYNKKELLSSAIESCISQLSIDDEIIIVDDNSNDIVSLKHLEKIKKEYSEINFVINEFNFGAAEAKNIGIRKSKNDIIVLLDADDSLPKNSLEIIRNSFNNNNIDLLFGNYSRLEVEKGEEILVNCKKIATYDNLLDPKILCHTWELLGTSPFKKDMYISIGGFDKQNPRTDDRDFHIRAILNNAKCMYVNENLYTWHRYPDGNNSNIPDIDTISSFFRNIIFYFTYCKKTRFILVLIKNVLKIIKLKISKND